MIKRSLLKPMTEEAKTFQAATDLLEPMTGEPKHYRQKI